MLKRSDFTKKKNKKKHIIYFYYINCHKVLLKRVKYMILNFDTWRIENKVTVQNYYQFENRGHLRQELTIFFLLKTHIKRKTLFKTLVAYPISISWCFFSLSLKTTETIKDNPRVSFRYSRNTGCSRYAIIFRGVYLLREGGYIHGV